MGEDSPFYGISSLFIGDKATDPNPIEASVLLIDTAEEGGDHTSASVLHDGKLEYSFSLNDENNEIGRWFQRMLRRFRAQRKALFFALTHGYTVRIPCVTDNGDEAYVELTSPSQLRNILRLCKFIPQFRIYDRWTCPCEIRRGRVRQIRVWPITKEMLEAYKRKLMEYAIEKE